MEGMRPDLVAPVVLWLCHDSCTDTGSVIEAAAGWVGKCELIFSFTDSCRAVPETDKLLFRSLGTNARNDITRKH